MDKGHTPAGYFIAIFAVLGATWLMPPLPILILLSPLFLVLGIIVCTLYSTVHRRGLSGRLTLRGLFPRARIR